MWRGPRPRAEQERYQRGRTGARALLAGGLAWAGRREDAAAGARTASHWAMGRRLWPRGAERETASVRAWPLITAARGNRPWMAVDLLQMSVRCDEHAPRAVRTALSRLDGLGRVLSDAMLIASELVNNAVLHSSCTAADSLDVRVTRNGRVRLCVLDPGVSGRAARITERPMGLGGLGLKIVQQLAEDWGSHRAGQGHEVWAELRLPTT